MGKLEEEVTSYIMWLIATFILANNGVMLALSLIFRASTNVRFRSTNPEQNGTKIISKQLSGNL